MFLILITASSNLLIILSSPSGAGKTTLCKQLLQVDEGLKLSISATTRPKRRGEEDGKDYIFMEKEDFHKKCKEDFFLEHAQIFENFYGTPKRSVVESLDDGFDVLFDVDAQGAEAISASWPGRVVRIFILPPSLNALEERLLSRGTENSAVVEKRLSRAEEEISRWVEYDYVVVNDELSDALDDLVAVIRAERLKAERFHIYT